MREKMMIAAETLKTFFGNAMDWLRNYEDENEKYKKALLVSCAAMVMMVLCLVLGICGLPICSDICGILYIAGLIICYKMAGGLRSLLGIMKTVAGIFWVFTVFPISLVAIPFGAAVALMMAFYTPPIVILLEWYGYKQDQIASETE